MQDNFQTWQKAEGRMESLSEEARKKDMHRVFATMMKMRMKMRICIGRLLFYLFIVNSDIYSEIMSLKVLRALGAILSAEEE